jgi:hypothetical protein
VQPALLLWQRTGDERLTRLFSAWMDTWVDATARAERGKPAGVIPAAIHWPTGTVGGPGPEWWDPRHHSEPTLYQWPSAVTKMLDTLLLTWHITGRDTYLEPIRSMARIRLEWLQQQVAPAPQPGSKSWCGSRLGGLVGTLSKYQLLSGSTEFRDLLQQESGTGRPTPDHDRAPLTAALTNTARALRVNYPGYTSEVRFTDRVLTFPRLYGRDMMFPEPVAANNRRPNAGLLYTTATGDRGGFLVLPLNAVRWLTPPRAIAALVTRSGKEEFAAELFHFGGDPRPMGAEFYLLANGHYGFELLATNAGTKVLATGTVQVNSPRTQIEFTLPARQLCRLRVYPK